VLSNVRNIVVRNVRNIVGNWKKMEFFEKFYLEKCCLEKSFTAGVADPDPADP
jgi:hypothetical protein